MPRPETSDLSFGEPRYQIMPAPATSPSSSSLALTVTWPAPCTLTLARLALSSPAPIMPGASDIDDQIVDAAGQVAAGRALDRDREPVAVELARFDRRPALDVQSPQLVDRDPVGGPLAVKAVSLREREAKRAVLDRR